MPDHLEEPRSACRCTFTYFFHNCLSENHVNPPLMEAVLNERRKADRQGCTEVRSVPLQRIRFGGAGPPHSLSRVSSSSDGWTGSGEGLHGFSGSCLEECPSVGYPRFEPLNGEVHMKTSALFMLIATAALHSAELTETGRLTLSFDIIARLIFG